MTQPLSTRKKIFYSIVTFLIIVVALELGLHAIDFVATHVKKKSPGQIPFRGLYQGKEWAPTLAREMDKPHLDQVYHQYLTWLTKPVKGQFLNVDRDTGRKTWNPPNLPQDPEKIFIFGGSAAWGYEARDNHTIPSDLSRLLNGQNPRFRVYNYAEPAYTFTQELIYFIILLQKGYRPQYVIFYDGFNDVYGAYQSGRAGSVLNLSHTREKMMSKPRHLFWQDIKEWLAANIYLYDKVYYPLYLRFHPEERYPEVGARLSDQELKTLAAEVVRNYVHSLDVLEHLSRVYGFKFICFWQPALFTETKIMPQEINIDERLADRKLRTIYRFTNQDLDRETLPHFHDISDAVGARTRPCYLDMVHMTEEGYATVAKRIYEVFLKEFPAKETGPSGL